MKQLPLGQYDFKNTEKKILEFWLSKPFFKPEYDPIEDRVLTLEEFKNDSRPKWTLICPPPNAYDRPHMGNLSGYPYMDALGRYNRMKGKRVLLFPGKDHAGIEGEVSYIRYVLEPQGKSKFDFSREYFYQQVYTHQQEYIRLIQSDEKLIGLSADYDRDLYTLDEKAVDVVLNTFIEMYNQKLIYKGTRIVNWDPISKSVLSDSQCIRKEVEGFIYNINYIYLDNNNFWFFEYKDLCDIQYNNLSTVYLPWVFGNNKFNNIKEGDLFVFTDLFNSDRYKKVQSIEYISWDELKKEFKFDNEKIYVDFSNKFDWFISNEPRGVIKIHLRNLVEKDYLTVATTRPETMFGDTGVAVNPDDERYKSFIGKKVFIPIVDRSVNIIFSSRVIKDFGTGVLKITPAHSFEDYEIMLEWNSYVESLERDYPTTGSSDTYIKIDYINVIDKNALICGPVPERYLGISTFECRLKIIEELSNVGLLVSKHNIKQNILVSERTDAIIQPLMASQWFVDVSTLKGMLVDVVANEYLKIYPKYAVKKYLSWVSNLRDWAISRSLWWGYRLPVWYHGQVKEEIDEYGKVVLKINLENNGDWVDLDFKDPNHMKVQIENPGDGWYQDEEILDTWFSSGQWPIVCLTVSNLLDTNYPTDVLVSGYDLLIKWDLFMILFGLFKTGETPFRNLYLTGLVKGTDGQKMSKSRKNFVPIDEVKENYGIDAFRMNCFYQNRAGRNYSITPDTLKNFRNFNNKIWNASKFVIMNLCDFGDENVKNINSAEYLMEYIKSRYGNALIDSDISMLQHMVDLEYFYSDNFEKFKFGKITERLYSSFWHYFCDIYIESTKQRLRNVESGDNQRLVTQIILYYSLKSYLKMLHPFIPFITEEIWQHLFNDAEYKTPMMYQFW